MRSLLRPAALLSHVLVLAVVGVLVTLGQWQLQRLEERRAQNELLEERLAAAPLDVADLAADSSIDDVALEYRRVSVTGIYLPDEELLLEGRSYQGQSGRDSFVPLELDDGTLVLVRRGWVPRELGPPPLADAAPPSGPVTVRGYLERSVPEPGFGPKNPPDGELAVIQVPDIDRIAEQLPGPTFPMIVRLVDQDPPPVRAEALAERGLDALPAVYEQVPFDEGSHLSYTLQWHSFALLALIAYVAYWVKRLREADGATADGVAPPSEPARSPTGV
ncbi:MAG: SURF1 family protein [Nitriliruptor sp.]|uniref:SURF1 family protein n=1 Tax=Nitriliruptor sp. TaxID=2448056 RepID=UPI0034A00E63